MEKLVTSPRDRNLASNLQARRTAMGLSQRKLAEVSGVARITIGRIETGRLTTQRIIEQLAAALNTTPAALLAPMPKARRRRAA